MPAPERPNQRNPEREPVPYHRATRFPGEKPAGAAYFAAQDAMYGDKENDLSVYRLQLGQLRTWHVAVLGEMPPTTSRRRSRISLRPASRSAYRRKFSRCLLSGVRSSGNVIRGWNATTDRESTSDRPST